MPYDLLTGRRALGGRRTACRRREILEHLLSNGELGRLCQRTTIWRCSTRVEWNCGTRA